MDIPGDMFSEFVNQDEEINQLFELLKERVPEYSFQIVLDQRGYGGRK